MIIKPIRTSVFNEGDDLSKFIIKHIKILADDSVLVVTSKIVALAEKRTVAASTAAVKDKLIRAESSWAIPGKYAWLTLKDGLLMPSAGIDESNAQGKLILLPRDSFRAARLLRRQLMKHYHVKNLGVLITDSRVLPLRAGVTGVTLGYSGFRGLKDYRNKLDIFKRPFKFSQTNVADGLAAAAVLAMGEGSEQQPLAIITKAPVEFVAKDKPNELAIPLKDDLYRALFTKLPK